MGSRDVNPVDQPALSRILFSASMLRNLALALPVGTGPLPCSFPSSVEASWTARRGAAFFSVDEAAGFFDRFIRTNAGF